MKNTFARFGKSFGSLLVVGGLLACGLFAGTTALVTVNLPHAVTVGNATLPSGQYTISAVDMASGDDLFIIRSGKGNTAITIQAQKVMLPTHSEKTQVTMSKDGANWTLDTLVVGGTDVSFQFTK